MSERYYQYKTTKYMNKCANELLGGQHPMTSSNRRLSKSLIMEGGGLLSDNKIRGLKKMMRGGGTCPVCGVSCDGENGAYCTNCGVSC